MNSRCPLALALAIFVMGARVSAEPRNAPPFPAPDGFVEVCGQPTIGELLAVPLRPGLERRGCFVPAARWDVFAKTRDPASLDPFVLVLTDAPTNDVPVSSADFLQIKQMIRAQGREALERNRPALEALIEQEIVRLSDHIDEIVVVTTIDVLSLGILSEGEHSISTGIFQAQSITSRAGSGDVASITVSSTLHRGDRIVWVNVYKLYRGRSDLEQAMEVTRSWVRAYAGR